MVTVTNTGQKKVLCNQHDYKLFPGLEKDLSDYARNWQGSGWDDLKVNVEYAEGTAIYATEPILTPLGQPETIQLIVDSTHIENKSDKAITTKIVLKGAVEQSQSVSVTDSFALEISQKIGGQIEIFSAEMQLTTTISHSSSNSKTETKRIEWEKSLELAVDPGKAYDAQLIASVKQTRYQFDQDATISGPVRIQYPSRRNGHYYWIFSISNSWHNTDTLSGIISNSFAIDAQILVSNSEIRG